MTFSAGFRQNIVAADTLFLQEGVNNNVLGFLPKIATARVERTQLLTV